MWGWYYQMWEKNTSATECGKSTVKCDVSIAQYDNETNKCKKKKIREPSNVTKVQSYVMLVLPNVTMELSNVRKKLKYPWMWEKYNKMWC